MPSQPDDAALIKRIVEGDVEAYEPLVKRYQAHVAGIVARKVPYDSVAEVSHEVFVRAYVSLSGYQGRKPFKGWLSTVAVRACHDFWRAHYKNREVAESSLSERQKAWLRTQLEDQADSGPWHEADRMEARQLLDWALGQLPAKDRMVLILVHVEGYGTAEAAEMMGMSSANVKVRCFRARKKLRRLITSSLDQTGETSDDG